MVDILLLYYLTLKANLIDVLGHVLKVDCDGGILQVRDFLDSNLCIFLFVSLAFFVIEGMFCGIYT